MTDELKDLEAKIAEPIAAVWDEAIKPLLNEQQRILSVGKDFDNDQLKGFVKAYRTLEEFAKRGKEIKAARQTK